MEILNTLKHKTNQSGQRRSQDFKFGDLIGSELEQMQLGPIKDMPKLDIQKLIYQAKYTNLQIASSSQIKKNFGLVSNFESYDVTGSESSAPMSSNYGSQQQSVTIDSNYSSFGY